MKAKNITLGALFLLAMAFYMSGSGLIDSSIANISALSFNQIKIGVFLEFFNSVAVIGIAALLFQVIKKHSPSIAIIYTSSRIIEAVFLTIASICVLVLCFINLDNNTLVSDILVNLRNLFFQMAMISLGAGSIFFCYILYKNNLIPRIISLFGIIGYTTLFISGWLDIFEYTSINSILLVPGSIFEIAFPIWLFVKGFNYNKIQ